MPTITPDQVETIFRDESYEAFLTALKPQADELGDFYNLFGEDTIRGYSDFKTNVYHSFATETARNPGEALAPMTNAQGYNYWTAIRAEYNNEATIAAEYLASVLKLGDYAETQGKMMAENYKTTYALYFTALLSYGAIAPATLAAINPGPAGMHVRARIFAQYLKGAQGAIIAEIPKTDAADPDGSAWFSATHTRANGDTSASFQGNSIGYFNLGSQGTQSNLILSPGNLESALLHMENDVPFTADRIFRQVNMPETLWCSGALRSVASQIVEINEFRPGTPNNDKNPVYTGTKLFGIKNIVVNRFLPANCWGVCSKGAGVKVIRKKDGDYGISGKEGPVPHSYTNMYVDQRNQIYAYQMLAYWSHMFDDSMDMTWYAGSLPRTLAATTNLPVAPATADLVNWND